MTLEDVALINSDRVTTVSRTTGCAKPWQILLAVCVSAAVTTSIVVGVRNNQSSSTHILPVNTTTSSPTNAPSAVPTAAPSETPTIAPTASPTSSPTTAPSPAPTSSPTIAPTAAPTSSPTIAPTAAPTSSPTIAPTEAPVYLAPVITFPTTATSVAHFASLAVQWIQTITASMDIVLLFAPTLAELQVLHVAVYSPGNQSATVWSCVTAGSYVFQVRHTDFPGINSTSAVVECS